MYKLQKVTGEETDNLNIPISIKDIKFVATNLPTEKCVGPDGFKGEGYETFKQK